MLSVASVMMKGCGRRPHTYTPPLTKPTAAPVASITMMTTNPEFPWEYTMAPTTDASANVDPTDRSMPRVRMTSNWPIASTAIAAVWESTLLALPVVRNTGDNNVMATTRPSEHQDRTKTDNTESEAQQTKVALLAARRCCPATRPELQPRWRSGRGRPVPVRTRRGLPYRRHSPSWSSCRPPRYGSPCVTRWQRQAVQ